MLGSVLGSVGMVEGASQIADFSRHCYIFPTLARLHVQFTLYMYHVPCTISCTVSFTEHTLLCHVLLLYKPPKIRPVIHSEYTELHPISKRGVP